MSDLFIAERSGEEQHDYKELTKVDDGDEDIACSSVPVLFDQQSLGVLIRDLTLSKKSSEILASRPKDQNGTKNT